MNIFHGIGNIGAKPEVKKTTGESVCNFSIAINERWTGKDGQKQERTEWVRVVVWGKQAENCAQYLDKGSKCAITGRIQTREWTNKEGQKQYTTEVVASNVEFLSQKNDNLNTQPIKKEVNSTSDDDIPF